MGSLAKGVVLGVVITLLAGIAVWLGVAYTGWYDVGAAEQHADIVRWTLETTQHRSVAGRADEVELPQSFSEAQLAAGAKHYAHSCEHCHGGPGRDPAPWSRGMRPEPPHLVEAAAEWEPAEIFWITENGIKMTGMPAFGGDHGREELVAITAFVDRLPGLSAEDYAALTRGGEGHGQGEGGEGDGDGGEGHGGDHGHGGAG